jgi:hypothetical protein
VDDGTVQWSCPKHGSGPFGFAFVCTHLALGAGPGFNPVPDSEEENESRSPALCDACEVERTRTGGYESSRGCAACYDEIKAQHIR